MKKLLYLLLGLLGFTSCEKLGPGECPVEYGCPTVDYIINGVVTDEDGAPIKGIKIDAAGLYKPYDSETTEYVSGEDGSFVIERYRAGGIYGELLFTDVDGEENGGEFADSNVNVARFSKKQVEEGEGWYSGKYEVTAKVKLKKK